MILVDRGILYRISYRTNTDLNYDKCILFKTNKKKDAHTK